MSPLACVAFFAAYAFFVLIWIGLGKAAAHGDRLAERARKGEFTRDHAGWRNGPDR